MHDIQWLQLEGVVNMRDLGGLGGRPKGPVSFLGHLDVSSQIHDICDAHVLHERLDGRDRKFLKVV